MSDDSGDDGVSLGNLAAIDDEFRLIAESIPHILWMSSPDGSAAFLNGEGWNYSGVGAAGAHASNWIEIIHPDDLDRVLSAWTEANRTHSRYSIECRIQRFDHEYRWHAFRARALCDPEGNVLRWIGTMTDIEDTKRLEAELRFQAELLGAVGHAIVAVDTDRRIIYWNTAAEEMYGWSAVEAVGRTSVEVLPRVESPDVEREIADAMRRGETWSGDYEIERRDGTRLAVLVTNRPMFGPDGRVVAVIGSSIDVTQRKAGEDAAQQLSAIVEGSGDAIFGVTDDGMVTSWNGAAERMFGYRAQDIVGRPVAVLDQVRRAAETRFEIGFEQSAIGAVISDMAGVPTRVNGAACAILGRPASMLVGRRWTEFSHPDDVPLGVAAAAWFDDGHDTYADERRYVRPDGTVVWTSTNLTVVRDEHGTHQYISMQLQDITARKQLENELAHEAMHDSPRACRTVHCSSIAWSTDWPCPVGAARRSV